MGDPNGPALDRRALLELLVEHGVEFLLVGGQAALAYGATRLTSDLDICVRWSGENLDRVGRVLVEIDAGVRVEGTSEPFRVPHRDGAFLAPMEISTWRSQLGDVDVLRGLPSPGGLVRFDDLQARAAELRVDGVRVRVASLEDVIVSKETTNRPSDVAALPELRVLARRIRLRGSPPGGIVSQRRTPPPVLGM